MNPHRTAMATLDAVSILNSARLQIDIFQMEWKSLWNARCLLLDRLTKTELYACTLELEDQMLERAREGI